MRTGLVVLALCSAIAPLGPALAGPEGAEMCRAEKLKRSGSYAFCRMKAESRAVKTGGSADYAKCDAMLASKFDRLDAKWAAECPTQGDGGDVQSRVTACTDALGAALSGTRFVDNLDGTVTDVQTGLTWEKKDALDGTPVTCPGGSTCDNPHDADNVYSWSAFGSDTDGGAFTSFLARLNDCRDDGSHPPTGLVGGFAGHCDWRLPTVVELQTILAAPFPCGVGACIDPTFGDTALGFYWSSTTRSGDSLRAWLASFDHGLVDPDLKVLPFSVRAVRGGD